MANKLYAMEQLTEEVAKDVAASPQEWMRFLNTASRLYKYTFPEQLLIYAQRPEATAVASMEIWNQKMYRWIKKGSKGIALIDNTSGPKTKLRYVFDVQDTYKVRNLGKDPQLWNLPVEGEHLVADYLQEQLSLEETEGGLAESLHQAAKESKLLRRQKDFLASSISSACSQLQSDPADLHPVTGKDTALITLDECHGFCVEHRHGKRLRNIVICAEFITQQFVLLV